jgi:integrase/recombinase XerD
VFYKYLLSKKKIDELITENIKNNKQQSQIPEILSEEEIYYIIENCDNDEKGKRDLVIIKILYETGMLISDLLKLTINDLNKYKYISYGSSKKSHVVTLGKELSEILKNYIDTIWFENYKNSDELLFPDLSRQNFAARLKKYAAKAGIARSIYPNMFRNTLAVNLLDDGRDIRNIKDRLNYVNISRTGIYNIRNKNDIKEIYDKIAIGDWNVPEDF